MKSRFYVIDGPNGSGKSSVLDNLQTLFASEEKGLIITKEPTSSALGKFIRQNQDEYFGKTLSLLVAADRAAHLQDIIEPNIALGNTVVSDRYIPSSLVYQSLDGIDFEEIWELNRAFLQPDIYFILNASETELKRRLLKRSVLTRFEKMDVSETIQYKKASEFLSKKGLHVETIENENSSAEQSAREIFELIKQND